MQEFSYANNLHRVRQRDNASRATQPMKNASQMASIAQIGSLSQHINPLWDWLYAIALALAILKDLVDLVGIGSLPLIGTVITILISLSLGSIMLLVGGYSKKKMARSIAKRYGTLFGGTMIEFLFGVNVLPIETLTIIIVYVLTLKERQENYQEERKGALIWETA